MHFSFYALPAMVALLAKAAIFFYAHQSKVHNLQTKLYLVFLFALSIQNLAEIWAFAAHADGLPSPPTGTLYFSASTLAIAFMLHFALSVAKSGSTRGDGVSALGIATLYIPALILQPLLWLTPLVVAGFEPMRYTYTKISGPLYFLFELYALGYLCATVVTLIYGARFQTTAHRRSQNKLLLLGLLPWIALVTLIIVLQQFGFRGFNSTVTLPIAITFFLVISAYATHQHRLFDIEFFVPWSKIRNRKTVFYRRIQFLIAEISKMSSVQKVLNSISDALHCPVALVGGPTPSLTIAGDAFGIARFPLDELKKVNNIVVANEIAEAMPSTHDLMKRHKVAAIVPFHPHSQAVASWMLLGEAFSEQVYSPLDFKTVETLFARLADHFLDNQLLLRSQLLEARREMDTLHTRLASAWEQIETLRRQLAETRSGNHQAQARELAASNQDIAANQVGSEDRQAAARGFLDEQVAEYEARLIARTMDHCDGDAPRAAELLGLPIATLHDKLRQIANRESDPPEPQVLFV